MIFTMFSGWLCGNSSTCTPICIITWSSRIYRILKYQITTLLRQCLDWRNQWCHDYYLWECHKNHKGITKVVILMYVCILAAVSDSDFSPKQTAAMQGHNESVNACAIAIISLKRYSMLIINFWTIGVYSIEIHHQTRLHNMLVKWVTTYYKHSTLLMIL